MEAHEAIQRVERMHGGIHDREGLASAAAVVVAVLAAFLAIATFLSNEQVKDVITKETRGADLSAQLEVNDVMYEVAEVGLQVGIVLAGISILVRRRWLLAGGGALGAAGIAVLIAGLAY